ncbi:MAG: isoprenoid biosynthesis glyoxalase ElbB [Phycisphaerae bacterium]|nr:isoprenoid biosynthesis glyoxalase ElbB [Phycisphaerae bacterium]
MAKVAVCLSGCGVFDGSEIHEAVLALLALDQAGAQVICCAPDKPQMHVVDHVQQKPAEGQTRGVLAESARIARGRITPLSAVEAREIDALIFPGGFGAAKNLCTFATGGADCEVDPDVERLVNDMIEMGKPVGFMCIAPALMARIAGRRRIAPTLTIGTDAKTAAAVEKMGAKHRNCPATDIVVDSQYRIVSTPAYMLASGPAEVFQGAKKLVDEVLKLAKK